MAFIHYVLELQRSMQKYLAATIVAKKEEEEAECVLRNVSGCKNIKSLPWKNEVKVKKTNNRLVSDHCCAAVLGAEAVFRTHLVFLENFFCVLALSLG